MLVDEGTLPCMDNLYAYIPIFSDIHKYCFSFGMQMALGLGAVALSLVPFI